MIRKVTHYIGIILALVILLTSNSLHYTHDVTHHHHDCSDTEHHDHHADECALCWFVFHQVSVDTGFDLLLPDFNIQHDTVPQYGFYTFSYQEGIYGLRGNKDPPLSI